MGRINPLIAIGVPTWTRVSTRWARMYRHIAGPLGSSMAEIEIQNTEIGEARNELMTAAIEQGADYLFMLGDDVLVPGNAILALLQRMWDDPEVHLATGVYWTKGWPSHPYLWSGMQRGPLLDWKVGEYFPVDWAGCDCLLIRLSDEIKALGPEWFSTNWKWEPEQPRPGALATEDFFFYTRARKTGIRLWVDTLVQCGHEDRESGIVYGIRDDMPQAGGVEPPLPDAKTDASPLVKVADIGAGHDAPYFGSVERAKVVRFDGNSKIRPDYRCDLRHLPVPDESFDVVHSRHALEHFGRADVFSTLAEWVRILRVGGELRLSVPNFLQAARRIIAIEEGAEPDVYPWWQAYGAQVDPYDYHKNGFTPRRLEALLRSIPTLGDISVEPGDDDNNLYGFARKIVSLAEPLSLTTSWDEIASTEQIAVDGLKPNGHDGTPAIDTELVIEVLPQEVSPV